MPGIRKGRGALSSPPGRFNRTATERVEDGWYQQSEPSSLVTTVEPEVARSIVTRNSSPDLPFEQSINPYRGCEHGCVYCFARPTHAHVGLSPGLDFETRLFYKRDAARLLEAELGRRAYRCRPIMLGTNTDPYQPIEREYRVTRSILEVALRCRHPLSILTKGALIERDLDLLVPLAERRLVDVMFSLPTLDAGLKRLMEPRAASPEARLRAMRTLHVAGVPVGVMVAPVIPVITDHEIERVLELSAEAGAGHAGYVLLRLPHEVRALFQEWLEAHFPQRATHVMAQLGELRALPDGERAFGRRLTGSGVLASLIRQRFHNACRRFALATRSASALDCSIFEPPKSQLQLGF
jgi:DNA repair photolyase